MKRSTKKVRSSLYAGVALVSTSLSGAMLTSAITIAAHAQTFPEGGASFGRDDLPPTAFIAQRGSLSLAQATAMAQSRFQGRVVRAETVQQGGRVVHEIRILGNDGRVRTVRIDAETGAVM